VEENIQNKQGSILKLLQSSVLNQELLAKIIEFFPYPILIYDHCGTLISINQSMKKEFIITDLDSIIGKFNILKEPFIINAGIINEIKLAFKGQNVFIHDVKVPLGEIAIRFNMQDFDFEAVYQDITIFPITDGDKNVSFVIVLLIDSRVYRGKNEILRAKEYIENHWKDAFDMSELARAAGLSKTHFISLFKKHTGMTPHEYYINLKINKIKKCLLDSKLSISQAFAACGSDYNGHMAKVFKDKVGFSPSQYRNAAK
jgi:AraC-like DNA-binding protein